MNDHELLNRYIQHGSADAFGELVGRHVDLVYAAALRQLHDPAAAEDVTQQVFVLLSRKARRLSPQVVLAGWLLGSTRFLAHSYRRSEARGRKNEERPVTMTPRQGSCDDAADWQQISPLLDDALADVVETNRLAVILKYLQGKSSAQVGAE